MTYVTDFGQTLQKISTYMNNNFHLKENLQKKLPDRFYV